ncbi:GNAT family N-acetyltransferase [Cognatiluteimonas profundi]|uniref:GNAT family N-acetyltransferase n=1 Tax=Cognatiluteimonas profundi TaxID=2594501 RepID=UPI00131EB2B4|nr:GNAT family N-acetyltransferase [Lysobacter profundi]
MAELTFRAATPADVPAVVALVESAYRGDSSRRGWTTEADLVDGSRTSEEDVLATILRPRSRIVLAEHDGALLACAHVADDGDAGYFGLFSVRPDLQGAGIGKAVMSEAERVAHEEWGLPIMRMTVIDVRQELIAFYQRHGYRRTGEVKPFPYGNARVGQPRRDDLQFAILEKRW